MSDTCPGSIVATFEEEPRGDEVAFVTMGKKGMTGARSSRAKVISLKPARCTVERFIGAASQAGVRWSPASNVFVGYGPTAAGAAWTVKRGEASLFLLADATCATGSP